jgi:hypothetical protein
MSIYKNKSSQKISVFAYTAATGAAKTGDAANITAYLSKDWGAAAAVTDTNPTELDATNMPGHYVFDLTQAETNAEVLILAPKSATAGVVIDQIQVFTQAAPVPAAADIRSAVGLAAANLDTQLGDVPTVTEFEARTIPAANYFDPAADTVANVTTVGTVTNPVTAGTVSDKSGYSLSAAGVQAIWDALTAALTTAGSIGKRIADNLDAAISSRLATAGYTAPDNASIAAILVDTGTTLPAAIGDIPTNVELTAALAAADDTVLAAISALNNLSQVQAQTAATAALNAYDPPTKTEMDNGLAALNNIAVADILAAAYEGAETLQSYLRLTRAVLLGESTGGGTVTRTFRDAADTKPRVTATIDGSSNRTAVLTDAS